MELQLKIEFNQLVQIAKKLPVKQWIKLKKEVEKKPNLKSESTDWEKFLLDAPTFSENQIAEIENARKSINQWRTK